MRKAKRDPEHREKAAEEGTATPGFLLTPSRRRKLEAKADETGLARLALSRTRGAEPTD